MYIFLKKKIIKGGEQGCCQLIDPWRTVNRLDNQSSKRRCIDRPITGAQRRDKRRAAAKYGRIKDYGGIFFLFF